jgi:Tfp pilus assembly protein PilN
MDANGFCALKIERMLTQWIPRRVLAVELAGDDIRAALVRRKGGRFEVLDFAALKRPDPQDDLPNVETLKALGDRLGQTTGPAVLVTPLARAFELLMDRKKISGLKHYQLLETVKWEVEPYTGITGASALIGVEPEQRPKARPGEIVSEDEDEQATVTVAAIERNVYRAARERFKAAGFELVRIYPPEVSFYYALYLAPLETPRALLEVGPDYSNFAILRGGVPEQINTLSLSLDAMTAHLSGEAVSHELEDSLRFTVRQTPEPEPLVISGPGAGNAAVVEFIGGFSPNGARPLTLSRTAGLADARDESAHAVFGTTVGAAVRELQGRQARQAGIDDRMPLVPRLKQSVYLAPLATALVLGVLLAGHYQFMKHQDRVYKTRITTLKADLKTRQAEIAKYEDLIKEQDALRKEIEMAKKRLAYIEGQADEQLDHLIACIAGLADALSDQIVLKAILQNGSDTYTVTGSAFDLDALGVYATRLQETAWCEAAVLQKLEKGDDGQRLDFEMTLKAPREAT